MNPTNNITNIYSIFNLPEPPPKKRKRRTKKEMLDGLRVRCPNCKTEFYSF